MDLLKEAIYEDTEAMETTRDKRRLDYTDPQMRPWPRSSFNSQYREHADVMWERARPIEISPHALLTRSRFEDPSFSGLKIPTGKNKNKGPILEKQKEALKEIHEGVNIRHPLRVQPGSYTRTGPKLYSKSEVKPAFWDSMKPDENSSAQELVLDRGLHIRHRGLTYEKDRELAASMLIDDYDWQLESGYQEPLDEVPATEGGFVPNDPVEPPPTMVEPPPTESQRPGGTLNSGAEAFDPEAKHNWGTSGGYDFGGGGKMLNKSNSSRVKQKTKKKKRSTIRS
jgi:hypothetical protein